MITLRVHSYESNLYSVGRVSVNCWSTVYRQTDDRFCGSCSSILPWRWGGRNLVNSGRGGEHRKQGLWYLIHGPPRFTTALTREKGDKRRICKLLSASSYHMLFCVVLPTENRDLRASYVHPSPTQGFLIGVIIQLMRAESNSKSFSFVFVIVNV